MTNQMSFADEYYLDMYRNIVLVNNCKEDKLICIINTTSFLNTICFFIFIILFFWFISILSRIYNSYYIMKYLKNRKAIYMKHMSRYIKEINTLYRSHVNDIIRIKKKIIPKNVEKIYLSLSMKNNLQLFKNYLSSSSNDLFPHYKYSISFSFSSKAPSYVQLYWGVLLSELNELIHNQEQLSKQIKDNNNTVICIDNLKNFFKDGFSKRMPSKKKSDATTLLLDKKKEEYYYNDGDNVLQFNSYFYKTSKTYFSQGNNLNYTMPYDENFCVTKILNEIENEKKQLNKKKEKEEQNKDSVDIDKEENNEEDDNIRIPLMIVFTYAPVDEHCYAVNSYTADDSIIETLGDTSVNKEIMKEVYDKDLKHYNNNSDNKKKGGNKFNSINKENKDHNKEYNNSNNYNTKELDNNINNNNGSRNYNNFIENNRENNPKKNTNKKLKKNIYNCNTLLVLVDFKKVKDKYKPFIVKDICALNQNNAQLNSFHKSKKKCDTYQFIDIMDIYGHEEHDKECLICMSSYKDTLLIPCRHSSFCYDCMKSLRQEKCPICRRLFTSFVKFPLKNMEKNDTVSVNSH